MPRFPESEAEILRLAKFIVEGLRTAESDLPSPPVTADELEARIEAVDAVAAATVVAESTLREHHAVKDREIESLVDGMKATLKYAEVAFRDRPERLSQLGWGPRRAGNSIAAPGEVRDIRIVNEGENWVILDWNAPVDGGDVGAYTIQRRKREGGTWEDIGTSIGTKQLMSNQPRGVEFEYRVVAVNKAGAGQPSGTVTVVL